MKGYSYNIRATWRLRPTPAAVLGEMFLRTLDLIAQAAPEIGAWAILDRPYVGKFVPIDVARKIMPKLLAANVATIEGEPNPDYGYNLIARNRLDMSPRSIGFSASVGGKFKGFGDQIEFEVGFVDVPSDPDVVTYPLFRAALLSIIAVWPCVWANAYAFGGGGYKAPTAPGVPPHPNSLFHLPWLSYLSAPLAKGLLPPPEIVTEPTPDGGLLMIAAEARLDPANPEQMRRSRAMAEIMLARTREPLGGEVDVDFYKILGLPTRH